MGVSPYDDGKHRAVNLLLPNRSVTLSATAVFNATRRGDTFNRTNFAATKDWALFRAPRISFGWQPGEAILSYVPFHNFRTISDGASGYVGSEIVYLGDHATHTRSVYDQRVTLVVPESVNATGGESVNPDRVFGRIEAASRRLDVGYRDRAVNVFFPTDPIGRGGLELSTARADDTWVHAADSDTSVLFSEYVHTRQSFSTSERMDWIVEAMDGYYSAALARELDLDGANFREEVVTEAEASRDVNLLDPAHDTRADYSKGARVLAALDARIRQATDGERTLEHVWARMNAHAHSGENPIDYPTFQRTVERVAGQSFDDWLTRSLETSTLPAVPANASLYTVEDDPIDLDGDGLSMAAERDAGSDPLASDTDGDGLGDCEELGLGTDPALADTDGDGLDDDTELAGRTNATVADTDGDGLADGRESDGVTNATVADTDGDGLPDGAEVTNGTDPTVADTDGDGLDDGSELDRGTNATVADTDGDSLSDGSEVERGTDPTVRDTDGDTLSDGREVALGTNATVADTDGDGIRDDRELTLGTDPTISDTDEDGIIDGREQQLGTNATVADTDGDGIDDGRELQIGSDPLLPDTDGDGLYDDQEVTLGTDPTVADTDGDGVGDWAEVQNGTDPLREEAPVTQTPNRTTETTDTATTTAVRSPGLGGLTSILVFALLLVVRLIWRKQG